MRVNERDSRWLPGLTLAVVRAREKPDADIVVRNGFPVDPDAWDKTKLAETDDIVLIRYGEAPRPAEMRALMQARHTPGVADTLAKATVGVAGVGGLGSHVAHALARIGVGKLILADADVVEPSNLNRQTYRMADIGRPKVEALAEMLLTITPLVKLEAHHVRLEPSNVKTLFRKCGIIAECFDRVEAKQMLVGTVLKEMPGISIVAASGVAGTGESNDIRTRKVRDRFYLVGDETSEAAEGMGLMAPRVMIAAGHQANAVIRILLNEME